jgi:hypothetical protein
MRAHLDTVEQNYWDIRKTELKEEK